jgi:outer membrane lipoprotein-sorting protein
MKKIFFSLLTLFFLFGSFANAQSLDEILAKHNKAMGQDKLSAIKSYTADAVLNQMGMEIPMKMKMKRPDKFYMELDVQGQKIVQAFDGKAGWMINPMAGEGVQDLEGAQLQQAKDQSNIDGPLYNLETRGMKAKLAGKVDLNGKQAYQIDVTDKDGVVQSYFLDSESLYLVSVKRKVSADGVDMEIEQKMNNYQVINGITMAMNIESVTPMGSINIKINKVEFDVPVDDAIFKKPVK